MNELIKIEQSLIGQEEVNSVDARALHAQLGIKKQFSDWVYYQITSLGLVKDSDYIVLPKKVKNLNGGRPTTEYLFTLDIAKHIALASRTKEGKEIRAYFIEVEKRSHKHMPQAATMSLLTQMSESINIMATNQGYILDRIEALEEQTAFRPVVHPRVTEHMLPRRANCMRGKKWTEAETQTLITMYDEGSTSAEIGAVVGKSAMAVRCRLSRLFAQEV